MIDPNLIYDVGMHRGEDAEFYLRKGYRVVGIEALPQHAAAVASRLQSEVRAGRLTIVECAVSDANAPLTFFENQKKSVWGTARADVAQQLVGRGAAVREVLVAGRRFGDIVREHGMPYFMKIDIEGADRLCLEGLSEHDDRPRYLSLETEQGSWEHFLLELDMMWELGYRDFKLVQQRTVHRQRCPRPALEGRYVDFRFSKGSSGLFGEESPGPWMTRGQVVDRYQRIFRHYENFSFRGRMMRHRLARVFFRDLLNIKPGWYDTHARLG